MISCPNCDDTGYVCEKCDQPDGQCRCAGGPTPVTCFECDDFDDDDFDDTFAA